MKILELLESFNIPHNLVALKPAIAKVAQSVYDSWDEEDIDTYGGGGICHLIADKIVELLNSNNIDAVSFSCSVGENHVMVACEVEDKAYIVDIPPYVYETGGGYNWNKIDDVNFSVSDITIEPAPSDFSDYMEEW